MRDALYEFQLAVFQRAVGFVLVTTQRYVIAPAQALSRKARAAWAIFFYGLLQVHMAFASSGIWSGYLCTAYSNVFSSELKTVISLVAGAGVVGAWALDDGQSKIKLNALRVGAAAIVLFNLTGVVASVSSASMSCSS
ncbi:hypothetical protein ACQUFY_27050 (plasmid) [Robbsia andropogonis]|uniref:hypothetical protein n=1 Tax=Robbsia andropogonis TaxID=28092 RepID=UPI003D1D7B46